MNAIRCLIFSTLLTVVVAACGTGLSLCGTQCYNPSTNSCPTDQASGLPVLCPVNYQACNKACFSPTQYHCESGNLAGGAATVATKAPATKAATSTTKAATSSTTKAAVKSTTASPVVTSSSTSPATKAVATTSSTVAAPVTTSSTVAAPATSSQAAANSGVSTCAVGCGTGLCNCNGGCYSPSQYNCPVDPITGKSMLCSGSFSACGGKCYDSSAYGCASDGSLFQAGQANNNNAAQATSTPAPVVNPTPVASGPRPTQTADLRIINSCKTTLWFEGRYGGNGAPIPGQTTTSTPALPGGYVDYTIPDTGLGGSRFWAKYGCDAYGKNCLVGDQMQYWPNPPGGCPAKGCTPPVDSLFEATWGCRPGTGCNSQNPTTWFDTSQVDGWTIPYKLTPNGDTSGCDCNGPNCGFSGVDASRLDLANCPRNEDLSMGGINPSVSVLGVNTSLSSVDLRIINNGQVLGCLSPCKRLNWGVPYGLQQDESSGSTLWMCCPTPTPDNCSPSNGCVSPLACRAGPIEKTQFVKAVHSMAPGIYSYSYDDGVGLHACPAGVVTYTMEFCPAGSAAYPAQA